MDILQRLEANLSVFCKSPVSAIERERERETVENRARERERET